MIHWESMAVFTCFEKRLTTSVKCCNLLMMSIHGEIEFLSVAQ